MNNQAVLFEHLNFPTADEITLAGLHAKPTQPNGQVVIFLHGNGSSSVFNKPTVSNPLAAALNEQGIGFLTFNNRGAGYIQKFRQENGEDVFLGSAMETIDQAPLDIQAAMQKATDLGYNKIYIYGHSSGANKVAVLSLLQGLEQVAGIILSAAGDDTGLWYQHLGKEGFWDTLEFARQRISEGRGAELASTEVSHSMISYQALEDVLDPDGLYNCFPFLEASGQAQLSNQPLFRAISTISVPTLVLYGSLDTFCVVPPNRAAEIIKQQHGDPTQVEIEIIDEADHSYSGREAELARVVTQWVSVH